MCDDLLREALTFLNDRPSFGLRGHPSATSYKLAARISAYLREQVERELDWADRKRQLGVGRRIARQRTVMLQPHKAVAVVAKEI